ncbi:MAG: DUF368 domain-containing protein [Firmicutes bacterium]|nr:DUF368 domain-containing protein [Bacillota bacterium]
MNIKDKIILGFKGFLIGLANIIPGVSGGTMAVSFGIYEEIIEITSNIFKNFKKNMAFILPIGIGAVIAIALLSNVITICLDKYQVATPLLFVGLILGGLPAIVKNIGKKITKPTNLIVFSITILFMLFIYLGIKDAKDVDFTNVDAIGYIILFIVGAIAAITMVVPGISGSFVLMLIGYYKPIVKTVSDLTHFNNVIHNLCILIPFVFGVLFGIVSVSKLIKYCLKKYPEQTYSSIVAFVLSSVVLIIYPLLNVSASITELIVGIVLLLMGSILTYKMEG